MWNAIKMDGSAVFHQFFTNMEVGIQMISNHFIYFNFIVHQIYIKRVARVNLDCFATAFFAVPIRK